jgi:hypothetical protein
LGTSRGSVGKNLSIPSSKKKTEKNGQQNPSWPSLLFSWLVCSASSVPVSRGLPFRYIVPEERARLFSASSYAALWHSQTTAAAAADGRKWQRKEKGRKRHGDGEAREGCKVSAVLASSRLTDWLTDFFIVCEQI